MDVPVRGRGHGSPFWVTEYMHIYASFLSTFRRTGKERKRNVGENARTVAEVIGVDFPDSRMPCLSLGDCWAKVTKRRFRSFVVVVVDVVAALFCLLGN